MANKVKHCKQHNVTIIYSNSGTLVITTGAQNIYCYYFKAACLLSLYGFVVIVIIVSLLILID